ncbi:MAG: metalloregulator ArsR/SmtB family transcription factor [Gemmataceae bacterium]|nr:metalloregulator ArsR/SmtB family transcription factor [Gemmataceae bacterium]
MKSQNGHECGDHPPVQRPAPDGRAVDRAARLFRALGDAPRLRLLHLLLAGEACVTELVEASGEKFPTVSQRLRILRTEGLVTRRRDKSHVYYGLADAHVRSLVADALAHAGELEVSTPQPLTEDES